MLLPLIPSRPKASILATLIAACALGSIASCADRSTQPKNKPTVWYICPDRGSDRHLGHSPDQAWKTFQPLNATRLGPGDEVIVAPGHHPLSLIPQARGSEEAPVTIRFEPGIHEFGIEQAARRQYFVSNSVEAAHAPMPVALLIKDCRHLRIHGAGTRDASRTTLMMTGRMSHFINDQSEHVDYRHLVFDLQRPTVSEFRVIASDGPGAEIRIAEGSSHEFRDGQIHWTGDIGSGKTLTQQAIPAEGRAWRAGVNKSPLTRARRIEPQGEGRYRLHFDDGKSLTPGHQYQIRHLGRDVVGAHNTRCRDIAISDCEFNAFAGMGIISQFTDTIRYQRVRVVPPAGTLRTCPAWADAFHFSGCRGQILIEDCEFSGTQDDPINVHGTHLQIAGQPSDTQLLVRFVHKQTYGFAAFEAGDEIAVIHAPTLREHPDNPRRTVTAVERVSDRDWRLTLDGPAPRFVAGDVVDNLSWYPDVTIRNNRVDMCSTRGFLCTSRGKVVIEGNTLTRCRMPGILIENDASGWFESGPVRDMTIRNNTLIGCDIRIHPRVSEGTAPVHENIRILDNTFLEGAAIEAHHSAGLVISHNRSDDGTLEIRLDPASTDAVVTDNE